MSSTEDYHRSRALEAALEWVLFRLLSDAKDPKRVLEDFNQHMLNREKQIDKIGKESLLEGKHDLFSSAVEASTLVSELRENLVTSVKLAE